MSQDENASFSEIKLKSMNYNFIFTTLGVRIEISRFVREKRHERENLNSPQGSLTLKTESCASRNPQ